MPRNEVERSYLEICFSRSYTRKRHGIKFLHPKILKGSRTGCIFVEDFIGRRGGVVGDGKLVVRNGIMWFTRSCDGGGEEKIVRLDFGVC